jgi:hypothetical protein
MGHLLKIKCVDSRVNVNILASTSVPFTLTTVQVPNLALTNKKRITVYQNVNEPIPTHDNDPLPLNGRGTGRGSNREY